MTFEEIIAKLPKPYFQDDAVVIYNADCRSILPLIPDKSIDLVLKNTCNLAPDMIQYNHEEYERRKQENTSRADLAAPQDRNRVAIPSAELVARTDSQLLQHFTDGNEQSNQEVKNSIKGARSSGKIERQIQERASQHALSGDDREGQMLSMPSDRKASNSPQEFQPSGQPPGESSSAMRELPQPTTQNRVVAVTKIITLTDPPYGLKRDKGFGGFGGFGKPIARRRYEDDKWDNERITAELLMLILSIGNNHIIFGGNFYTDILPQSNHWLVWDKLQTMPTFGDCELAWTDFPRNSIKKYQVEYNGLLGKEDFRYHPTQKPVKLFTRIINDYSKPNDLILDPFLGSGTTLVCAKKLGRKAIGIEIEEKYCRIAVERLRQSIMPFGE